MKKSYLFIILGVVLVFLGVYITFSFNDNNNYGLTVKLLSKEEATNLISEKVNYLIKIYENSSKVFNVETIEENGKKINKINNYDDIVNSVFTKEGLKQFESTVFGKENFVTKKDDGVYFLTNLPSDNSYLDSRIVLSEINIKENKVTATVSFYNSKLENNDLVYYVIVKKLELVKENDSWYVENFLYLNEK